MDIEPVTLAKEIMEHGGAEITEDKRRGYYAAFGEHEALRWVEKHIITIINALPEDREELKREFSGLVETIQIRRKKLWKANW